MELISEATFAEASSEQGTCEVLTACDDFSPGKACDNEGQLSFVNLAKDVDIDALAVKLDGHAQAMRSDLLGYFLHLKEQHWQRRCEAVKQQRQECDYMLLAKDRDLHALEQATASQKARNTRLASILGNAVYKLYQRKQTTVLGKAWHAWIGHIMRSHQISAKLAKAMLETMRKAFTTWRTLAHKEFSSQV